MNKNIFYETRIKHIKQKTIHEGGILDEFNFNRIQCYKCTLALRNAISSIL